MALDRNFRTSTMPDMAIRLEEVVVDTPPTTEQPSMTFHSDTPSSPVVVNPQGYSPSDYGSNRTFSDASATDKSPKSNRSHGSSVPSDPYELVASGDSTPPATNLLVVPSETRKDTDARDEAFDLWPPANHADTSATAPPHLPLQADDGETELSGENEEFTTSLHGLSSGEGQEDDDRSETSPVKSSPFEQASDESDLPTSEAPTGSVEPTIPDDEDSAIGAILPPTSGATDSA